MRNEPPFQIAALASGGGSTFEAIVNSCRTPSQALHGLFEVACLVVSDYNIGAIDKAKAMDMEMDKNIHVCRRKDYPSSEAFGEVLIEIFTRHNVDMYGQYGWTTWTPENVIRAFLGLNQHPVIPEYFGGKGMHGMATHQAVLNFCDMIGRRIPTEAVAQLVAPIYDEGAVILSESIPVYEDDTVKKLQERVLEVEHRVQIAALVKMAAYFQSDCKLELSIERNLPELSECENGLLAKAKEMAIESYPGG